MNPLDEYFMTKEAFGLGGVGSAIKGALGSDVGKGLAVTVGSAALLAGAVPAAQKIWGAVTRQRDFKEMMSTNPDLVETQREDPRFFNSAYNSLRRVNPTLGRDPIIAGSYMKKMMANRDAAGLILAGSVKSPEAGFQSPSMNVEMSYSPKAGDSFPSGLGARGRVG